MTVLSTSHEEIVKLIEEVLQMSLSHNDIDYNRLLEIKGMIGVLGRMDKKVGAIINLKDMTLEPKRIESPPKRE